MIKILIVDDNAYKQQRIGDIVQRISDEYENINVYTATEIITAKNILAKHNIDIMVLDICLPMRISDTPIKDGGIKLLNEIQSSPKFNYPKYVISVSQYEDEISKFDNGQGIIHESIHFDETKVEWSEKLYKYLSIVITVLSNNIIHRSYDFDIAIICALPEELELAKSIVSNVKPLIAKGDPEIYFQGSIQKDDRRIRVVMTNPRQMGMVAAATLTNQMINSFTPRYIVMIGIAAGVNKNEQGFGDPVVASSAWDYGAGKNKRDGEEVIHLNTIQLENIDSNIESYARRIQGDNKLLYEIKVGYIGTKPATELKVHIGPVASGAAVVADENIIRDIKEKQIRDTVALEMEIYGVYFACNHSIEPRPKVVAIKSICDFADMGKNDNYHDYSSYTSAKILEKLILDYFDFDE